VATDLDLAANVRLHLAAQVTFDLVVGFDPVAKLDQLFVAELMDPEITADTGVLQGLPRTAAADAEDVGESDLEPLVAGEVDAEKACHRRAVPFVAEVLRATPAPLPGCGPGLRPGVAVPGVPAHRPWPAAYSSTICGCRRSSDRSRRRSTR